MGRPKLKIDKEAWLEAIQETGGMVTLMAPKLGISRQTIARFRDEVEWFAYHYSV
jgi:transcriptional regulator of acetoin/glycerol metabolism